MNRQVYLLQPYDFTWRSGFAQASRALFVETLANDVSKGQHE